MQTEKYYVVMTDRFFVGKRIKKLVYECDTLSEAETVKNHALYNDKVENVNIRKTKSFPTFNAEIYDVEYHNRDDSRNWYR